MLPDFIRRRFVIRKQTLYPNVKRGLFSRILSDGNTLATITKGVVADASSQVCIFKISLFLHIRIFKNVKEKSLSMAYLTS